MNILSLIKSQLPPQAISQISNTVGESPENTQSALGAAFPAILGSLLGKANATPDGAAQVFNALQQRQENWTDSIGRMLSGGGQAQSGAGSLLNSLLGSRLSPVAEFIAGHCGVKSSSATSLLGMAAPIVMGTLSKQVSSENLGAAGLGQLLNSQAEHLKDALPAGLANTLGIGSLLSGAHETTRVPTAAEQTTSYASDPAIPVGRVAPRGAGSSLKWAVPLIAIAALALWALASHSGKAPAAGGTEDYPQTQAGHGVSMPSLSSLNLPPGSIGERMVKAASNGDWKQTFDLSNLSFDSGGHLTDSAAAELQQLGSILTAAPNLNVSITSFSATQDEGMAKANSIKSALTSMGVSSNRVITRGATGSGVPNVRLMK
jgi:OOP family OmpA-OmpF porin